MINRQQLAKTIAELTIKEKDLKKLTKEVAAYLLAEHKSAELSSIIRDVIAYRAELGRIEATVVSAHPLTSQIKKDVEKVILASFPDAKSVTLNETIEPSVVGGMRLEMINLQIDETVQSKLNTLKRRTAARKDI